MNPPRSEPDAGGAPAAPAADRGRCGRSAAVYAGGAPAWLALALLLGAAAAGGGLAAPASIDWQPLLAASEPWRAWSAAALHYSRLHLGANLAGLLLAALLGGVVRVPARSALAWFLAWPLTQFALLVRADLGHAGGLSGVLHAGVAVAAVHLLWCRRGVSRGVGAALLAGLLLKVLGEAPWAEPLRHPAGWDIAVAPAMHAGGLAAGVACAVLLEGAAALRRARRRDPHGSARGGRQCLPGPGTHPGRFDEI